MKRVSIMSLAAALAIGGVASVATAPAQAMQAAEQAEEFDAASISDAVRGPVAGAQEAMANEEQPADPAAVRALLEQAEAAIANQDDRFIVGQMWVQLAGMLEAAGAGAEEIRAMQARGIQLALDSNRVPLERRGLYWTVIGNAANARDDHAAALTAYQNAVRYDSSNADAYIQLALASIETGDLNAGYEYSETAFETLQAAGQEIPASWHTVPFRAAYEANDVPRVLQFGSALLQSYPTNQNWNEVLRVYQTVGRMEEQANLDLLRLMRAAGALDQNTVNEYVRLAARRGLPGEAVAVYEAAIAGGAMTENADMRAEIEADLASDRAALSESEANARSAANGRIAVNTGDAYASYGQNEKALELYALALEKGGVDAGTVHLRRGAVLHSMGRTDEARQEFEAVTGDRQGHARFWLLLLDQQAGAGA